MQVKEPVFFVNLKFKAFDLLDFHVSRGQGLRAPDKMGF